MLTPVQADGLFEVLLEELDVDPAGRETFVAACRNGAARIGFLGFSGRPQRQRPRFLLLSSDLEHIRCSRSEQEKLAYEEKARCVKASTRIADILAYTPVAPLGTRSRVSGLAV